MKYLCITHKKFINSLFKNEFLSYQNDKLLNFIGILLLFIKNTISFCYTNLIKLFYYSYFCFSVSTLLSSILYSSVFRLLFSSSVNTYYIIIIQLLHNYIM